MPPWQPIKECMQRFCEPFFTALERWRKGDPEILKNRLELIEASEKILANFPEMADTFVFGLESNLGTNIKLHPEVIPVFGKEYLNGGDIEAFSSSKSIVPKEIFTKTGVFYQNHLLLPMAGFNEYKLSRANSQTRNSIIRTIEKLFRVTNESGKLAFSYKTVDSTNKKIYATFGLSKKGLNFYNFLIDFNSGKLNSPIQNEIEKSKATWKYQHSSIGKRVADNSSNLNGVVKKVSLSTSDDEKALKYFIRWENGESSEFNHEQLIKGIQEYDAINGWSYSHPSIGTYVAAFFYNSSKTPSLYSGKVTKYLPKTCEDESELFHIEWDDGDEEDYDSKELEDGKRRYEELWKKEFEILSPSPRKRKISFSDEIKSDLENHKTLQVENPHMPISEQNSSCISNTSESELNKPTVNPNSYDHDEFPKIDLPEISYETPNSENDIISDEKGENQTKTSNSMQNTNNDSEDDIPWTESHPSVGTKVAGEFFIDDEMEKKGLSEVFYGKVSKYAPPSKKSLKDQLYHVIWDDGDEQDLDEGELRDAIALYNSKRKKNNMKNKNKKRSSKGR